MTLLIDRIGELVTNDPTLGEGPLGVIRSAAVVIEDERIVWVGSRADVRGDAADDYLDTAGRAVLPGFVEPHAHLVFAGDRADEFAARMAGQPFAAGGIRATIARTRAATRSELSTNMTGWSPSISLRARRPSSASRAMGRRWPMSCARFG